LTGAAVAEIEAVRPSPRREVATLHELRSRGRVRGAVALFGPAFVAAVAYIDPGNFATNFTAGAHFGYTLVWVIVAANLMAMLVQYLSAKTGVATGKDLPELCREHFPRPVSRGLWVQAELIAMATDLAEFVGAAVGLNLLFGVPLFPAGLMTAVVAFLILALEQQGYRRFELAITGLLAIVFLGFAYDLLVVGASAGDALGGLVPSFAGSESVLLAAGIIGATVMPHVVYLHSALARDRFGATPEPGLIGRLLKATRADVGVAMLVAGTVNIALLLVAAASLRGVDGTDTISGAHAAVESGLGTAIGVLFAVGLLVSGLASTSVGCYAGAVIMEGLLLRRIPLLVRRLVTLVPAVAILLTGAEPTWLLVLSQVVLSFGIPFAIIPLVAVTAKSSVMGRWANSRLTTTLAVLVSVVVVTLNVALLALTITG
jgi:manganese transport protein